MMNRKFLFWSVVMACCAGSVLTSCSDDTVPENSTPDALGTGAGTYVVAATVDVVRAIEKVDDMIQYEKVDGDGGVRRIDLFDAGVFSCCQMLADMALGNVANKWLKRE